MKRTGFEMIAVGLNFARRLISNTGFSMGKDIEAGPELWGSLRPAPGSTIGARTGMV
jgi:hypothetical protein